MTTICWGDNHTGKNFVPPIKPRSLDNYLTNKLMKIPSDSGCLQAINFTNSTTGDLVFMGGTKFLLWWLPPRQVEHPTAHKFILIVFLFLESRLRLDYHILLNFALFENCLQNELKLTVQYIKYKWKLMKQ